LSNSKNKPPIYLVSHGRDDSALIQYEPAPLGLLYVGQALADAGYRVRVLHLHGEGDRGLEQAVNEEKPLFVGFSNFLYPRLKHDVALSRFVKSQGIKVVWGGIFSTTLPEVPLASDCVDYIVRGEGELVAPRLALAIENNELPRGIAGVGYRDGEEIVLEPPDPPEKDIDQFRFGVDLIDFSRHIENTPGAGFRVARVPFSRGCPFRCTFCYNSVDSNRQVWRSHSNEYMKDLVGYLVKRYNINRLGVVADNPFGAPKKAMKALSGLGVPMWTLGHISSVSPEFVAWAKENQLVRISFGFESGSDRVLKEVLGKTFSQEDMTEGVRLCREGGMETLSAWMALIPGETDQELQQTLDRIDEFWRQDPNHGINFNLFRLYPQTPIWDVAKAMGHQEPETIDQWADYDPEAYPLLGYSRRRAKRLHTLALTLYPFNRHLDSRVPAPLRAYLKRRLKKRRMIGPVEEMAYAGWQVVKAARRLRQSLSQRA